MVTYKGAVKTIADAVTVSHVNDPGAGEGSNIRVQQDTYEASAIASGSLIEIGSKLPLGAYVYETILGYDALGASTSLSLGDAEDDDRYISAVATTSTGITRTNKVDGMNYKIDETAGTSETTTDRQILVKVVDSGAATGTIRATILWAK